MDDLRCEFCGGFLSKKEIQNRKCSDCGANVNQTLTSYQPLQYNKQETIDQYRRQLRLIDLQDIVNGILLFGFLYLIGSELAILLEFRFNLPLFDNLTEEIRIILEIFGSVWVARWAREVVDKKIPLYLDERVAAFALALIGFVLVYGILINDPKLPDKIQDIPMHETIFGIKISE